MDLTSLATLKTLLASHGIFPHKSKSQNFLVNTHVLENILAAADLHPSDTVLEIGPGPGVLTQALAPHVKRLIAIELDTRMVALLKETMAQFPHVEIIHDDILNIENGKLKIENSTTYKVVANLPYAIATAVIQKFLSAPHPPSLMVVMVQREVAQRMVAQPPHMNLLAVATQYYGTPRIVATVPAHAFWPQPRVTSAIVKIVPHARPLPLPLGERTKVRGDLTSDQSFFCLLHAGFAHPRKHLASNLAEEFNIPKEQVQKILESFGLSPTARAQELGFLAWQQLGEFLKM